MLIAAGSLALGACKTTPKELPPEPTQTPAPTGGMDTVNGIVPGSQADFLAKVSSDTVYFDTDESNIDSADMATLQSQAQWLMQFTNKRITIEGHCDERGTREYNLALGERRANAAKNYLVGLGIDASRISTLSYGKERPKAMGSNEGAWAQNRRAVTVTVQ
ncbi:peptidoglycan-associated lipoprotein Pal [Croceicoccus ponticola]|uniref:Peptidoglycan-associated protein n=1 Tax=Croceicoccus ponticola TaxID=2217664 RepID=A0A437H2K8_9SPHN|nr:peptidoglycan-associated lipoprotein Pal [Croceicoccus ponticola]